MNKSNITKRKKILYRWLLGIVVYFALVGSLIPNIKVPRINIKESDIAKVDIFSPCNFPVVDKEKTAIAQQEAVRKAKPVYEIDTKILQVSRKKLYQFFDEIEKLYQSKIKTPEHDIEIPEEIAGITLSSKLTNLFVEYYDKKLEEKNKDILTDLFSAGIVKQKKEITGDFKEVFLKDVHSDTSREVPANAIISMDNIDTLIQSSVEKNIQNGKLLKPISKLIKALIVPNISYDRIETEKEKERAVKNAPLQYKTISKGESIIRKGEKVTKEQLEYINALNQFSEKSRLNWLKQIAGVCLSFLIIIFILNIYINKFLQHVFSNITSLAIVSLVTIGFVAINKIILTFSLSPYLIPTAAVAIMLATLLNVEIAFIINLALCIFIGIATDYKFDYFFVATVGGITAILYSTQTKRRIDIIKIGFIVGLVNVATIISIDLHKGIILGMMFDHIKWGFANGIISSFIAAGLLPILEHSFNIPTDAKLLELLDLNRPILKQLSKEAPGTYQSCLAVGTLAEAASDSIKANSLLTKVASYYHDIGKIKKASYFIENQIQNKNIHNKITPIMSNLVLISHVKDGVKAAKEANLPKLIIDIIEQHHGTTLTSFFFQRALEKDNSNSVKEEDFRYPGPKPQTKEAAVVMLADSVEAASRTLDDPTSSRIKTMVEKIINNKFSDHQLNESALTLKDLSKIAKSFTHILISMFHTRIEYPDTNGSNESRDNQSSKKDKNK
ncbi:MAG: HDIG domain-containing protein [bacterium]|nr:HDIG domain-containing protein [bacterium]